METPAVARQMSALQMSMSDFFTFISDSTWARRRTEPGIVDFTFGNPHEPPLPAVSDALRRWALPQHPAWFAYQMNEPHARAVVAAALRQRRGLAVEEADIFLTTGAFAGLAIALRSLVDPGDDVLYLSPPWFFYAPLIRAAGATPVRVTLQPPSFDLDVAAIAAALTPRTRAIIVNSPHNPTGVIYPPTALAQLAALLTDASARQGRSIYLLSDEAYSRIVFDAQPYVSPTVAYPYSMLIYTYGKQLLTPGQRVGYLALPPSMPLAAREALRPALFMAQAVTGYAFPNALLQHALGDLDALSIDVAQLQRKRDRLVGALRGMGYEVHVPAGTFYLLPRAPLADDVAFAELLAQRDVFVLPGTIAELPGYIRLSLTASDAMIERALPAFQAAMDEARRSMDPAELTMMAAGAD